MERLGRSRNGGPGVSRSVLVISLSILGILGGGRSDALLGQGSVPQDPKASGKEDTGGYAVKLVDIDRTILVTGELRAERSREISVPRIRSGFSNSVTYLAPEGYKIKAGERLLEFDASGLLSQKSEAERALDEAKLKIEKTRADLEAQRADFLNQVAQAEASVKIAKLYGDIPKELLPANQYQKYQLDLEKAELALTKAKERLENHNESYDSQLNLVELEKAQAELDLKKIEGDLELLTVDAPQEGVVIYGDNWASNRKIQVGDTLFPGMTVVTLPDMSSLGVLAYIYDTELRFISKGMRCELHLDAVPGRVWKGILESVTSVAGRKGFASQHKVFQGMIKLDSLDLDVMKPGMTVRVEIQLSLASQVVAIPREYLGLDVQGSYFVRKGRNPEGAQNQPVEVGVSNYRWVQVRSGLNVGDTILPPVHSKRATS